MKRIDFSGQVAIVTGAGGGLGRAYALAFAERGAAVVVNDLGGSLAGKGSDASLADATVAAIRDAGGKAIASHDDVSTHEGGQAIAALAMEQFGRIDALVNNAGNMRFAAFEDLTGDDLQSLLAVHVGGAFHVTQAAWPYMKRQRYGRIVFTTSSGGMLGSPMLSAYGAAKGGVMGLMHCLAEEGAPHGIVCNAIMPNAASRMGAAGAGMLGDIPGLRELGPSFDPRYSTGLALFLASAACEDSHGIYSALGNRTGRIFVGVTDGWREDIAIAPSPEDIAEHWPAIRDAGRGFSVPANVGDEFRIVAGSQQS